MHPAVRYVGLGADIELTETGDIAIARGEQNLAQAILNRIRTGKGELQDTGHSGYGSTLYDVIGEPNNEATRNRLRLIIRDALSQEPRIKEVKQIRVIPLNYASANSPKSETSGSSDIESAAGSTTTVTLNKRGPDRDGSNANDAVEVEISVVPIGSNVILNLVFPFYLGV